jgi:AraC family transcriptional regulator, melibiose operon regulatory protein
MQTQAASPSGIYDPMRAFGDFAIRTLTPGVMIEPHWHGHVEMNIIAGAALIYDFDGDRVEVADGGAALFWAGVPHRAAHIIPASSADPVLTNIYLPLDRFLLMPHVTAVHQALLAGGVIAVPDGLVEPARLERWRLDLTSGDEEPRAIVMMELNALLRRLCTSAFRFLRLPSQIAEGGAQSANIRHVVAMIRHIVENLEKPLSNASVAAVTGLHANYALNVFSAVMRIPMKRFIIRMRLARARALLTESDLPVATIAAKSGFGSISQFYDSFRQAYGETPKQARRAA